MMVASTAALPDMSKVDLTKVIEAAKMVDLEVLIKLQLAVKRRYQIG